MAPLIHAVLKLGIAIPPAEQLHNPSLEAVFEVRRFACCGVSAMKFGGHGSESDPSLAASCAKRNVRCTIQQQTMSEECCCFDNLFQATRNILPYIGVACGFRKLPG